MTRLAWRMLRRELRAGELRLLFVALVVAVTAVTSVGFLTDRLRQALVLESHQLLGADLVLVSDHPWATEIEARAAAGLRVAQSEIFTSMVVAGDRTQLADIKAVSEGYPLRGQVRVARASNLPGVVAEGGPPAGGVWIEERLAGQLEISVGDQVSVGLSVLRVAGILVHEPDRGFNFFSLAPRLMMRVADLQATGLIQSGSRVSYRLLLAGDAKALADLHAWLSPRLGRGERVDDAENARPEVRSALERAQRFLGLASLLTAILAAVAIALAARRYTQRHLDTCAIMRCLGATQGNLLAIHGVMFLQLAVLAAGLGCALGYGAGTLLQFFLRGLIDSALPAPSFRPVEQACLVAGVLLLGFAMPPVLRLRRVPTLRVLRRDLDPAPLTLAGGYGAGALLFSGLVAWMADDARLGAYVLGGVSAAAVVFVAIGYGALTALGTLRFGGRGGWRQGLVNLRRFRHADTVQVVALAVGVLAMLLLTVTRNQLLSAWQQTVPADAPNRFVINIQPEQVEPLAETLASAGVRSDILPMVRGRLLRIGEREVSAASYPDDERAQRLVEREFNLSWRADMPPGNTIVAGRWFADEETGRPLASVEEGLAKTLGIGVGDRLSFSIGGARQELEVVGLRKLDWDSMRVNFFVLTPPGVIDGSPGSYITSFHLAQGHGAFARTLLARFPNLTVIDVSAILGQLVELIGRLSQAVQFVFLFTLLASVTVLYAALLAAADERRYEFAVLRALGASRSQLRTALVVELAAVGAVAGLIAGGAAQAIGMVMGRKLFQLEVPPDLTMLPLTAAITAGVTVALGWVAIGHMLRTPTSSLLREGQ